MYFVEFFKNLFKKSNVGTLIWMIFNAVIICLVFVFFSGMTSGKAVVLAIFAGLLSYVASVALALSPIGEAIMRLQQGCKEISDPNILNRIKPLFEEVYSNAKGINHNLQDNIKLFMINDSAPNAFALGRQTVCITRGLLSMSDDDIRGILGHEFGHLSHKDTDTLLVITVGNLIVAALFAFWRFFFNISARLINFFVGIVSHSWGALIAGFLTRVFVDFLLVSAMALWTKLGVLICLASSRANEYLADRFSFEMGYGYQLGMALHKLEGTYTYKGVWAALNSSHPATPDRIDRLNKLLRGDTD